MDIENYKTQLQIVENALKETSDEVQRQELESLRLNLVELLELSTGHGEAVHEPGGSPLASGHEQMDQQDDSEMLRFINEIKELENPEAVTKESDDVLNKRMQQLKDDLEKIVGQKCSAPHQHSWGSTVYHNAIVCGVADIVDINNEGRLEGRLRVFFTNPTHKEMLPCSYFLNEENGCRFDENSCHYSHGEVVALDQLREYVEPDFERLARNCVVLAKSPIDRLWQRGRVICVNFVEKQCRVRLDARFEGNREKDYKFEDLLPIFQDEDLSSGSSSDSDSSDSESESNHTNSTDRAAVVQQSLFTFQHAQALGEWEKHTKGIGSKLMERMGYIHGTGLGSAGQGIVVPISAQILPQGRSLDYCMQLREKAKHDDLFSVERILQREKKKQEARNIKAYNQGSGRADVFSFLNKCVFTDEKNIDIRAEEQSKKQSTSSLKEKSTKTLNIESVKISDEIRKKEREVIKTQESLRRNAHSTEINQKLQTQLKLQREELQGLQKKEKHLYSEQALRKSNNKFSVF